MFNGWEFLFLLPNLLSFSPYSVSAMHCDGTPSSLSLSCYPSFSDVIPYNQSPLPQRQTTQKLYTFSDQIHYTINTYTYPEIQKIIRTKSEKFLNCQTNDQWPDYSSHYTNADIPFGVILSSLFMWCKQHITNDESENTWHGNWQMSKIIGGLNTDMSNY